MDLARRRTRGKILNNKPYALRRSYWSKVSKFGSAWDNRSYPHSLFTFLAAKDVDISIDLWPIQPAFLSSSSFFSESSNDFWNANRICCLANRTFHISFHPTTLQRNHTIPRTMGWYLSGEMAINIRINPGSDCWYLRCKLVLSGHVQG